MPSTITHEQEQSIAAYFEGKTIPTGLGTKESACSLAGINLALSGRLTDGIPGCMSPVIGSWIIATQDTMPDAMRNSAAWRDLLPYAAGTGREHEAERLAIIIDWMWGTVLPTLQPVADQHGYGAEWSAMTTARTREAATVALAVALADADAVGYAADAAYAACYASYAAGYAAADADAVGYAADAAAGAAYAAGYASYAAGYAWDTLAPAALLAKLVAVGAPDA